MGHRDLLGLALPIILFCAAICWLFAYLWTGGGGGGGGE